ncbi:hypothetical protein F4802DRAFT_617819 [Xylaria palmicola]|nr:hypothetical protein F4802DRAFT_617819 [Xylaria palmicola]
MASSPYQPSSVLDRPTVFDEPSMVLASQFPELDPVAILQVVESPAVLMAFNEFRLRLWNEVCEEPGVPVVDVEHISRAITNFTHEPFGQNLAIAIGGGPAASPYRYHEDSAFSAFMSRVYKWIDQEYLDLPIRKYLVADEDLRIKLLWGILGVCIDLLAEGELPRPRVDLPPKVDTANTVADKRTLVGAVGYDATWFPQWQEWRMRHALLADGAQRDKYVRTWASRIADECREGDGGSSSHWRTRRFIGILHFVKGRDESHDFDLTTPNMNVRGEALPSKELSTLTIGMAADDKVGSPPSSPSL